MDTQKAINEILSQKHPGYRFSDLFEKFSHEQAMEIYVECALRSQDNFTANLSYCVESSIKYKEGYYPYIRFDAGDFVSIISRIIKEYNIKSFLDVGAGYGDKVAIAKKLVGKASGIEYSKEYVNIAKKFGVSLITADAFNFTRYSKYDLIYMFHPIQDEDLYIKMVNTIISRMANGTFLVEVLDMTLSRALKSGKINKSLVEIKYGLHDSLILRKL